MVPTVGGWTYILTLKRASRFPGPPALTRKRCTAPYRFALQQRNESQNPDATILGGSFTGAWKLLRVAARFEQNAPTPTPRFWNVGLAGR